MIWSISTLKFTYFLARFSDIHLLVIYGQIYSQNLLNALLNGLIITDIHKNYVFIKYYNLEEGWINISIINIQMNIFKNIRFESPFKINLQYWNYANCSFDRCQELFFSTGWVCWTEYNLIGKKTQFISYPTQFNK